MDLMPKIFLGAVLAAVLFILLRVVQAPMRLFLRLLLNTALGFFALYIVNLTTVYTGLSLGLNLCNALVIGILGVPGLGLLLLLQWIL